MRTVAWIKIDDQLHAHPKINRAWRCRPALGLHMMAMSYCGAYLTDGFVDKSFVEGKIPEAKERRKVIGSLLAANLWSHADDGYRINDFLDFNRSRVEIEEQRRADAARKAVGKKPESEKSPKGIQKPPPRASARRSGLGSSSLEETTTPQGEADFEDWLAHHEQITGNKPPKPGTQARATILSMYQARRAEDYDAEELKRATIGAFNDPHRREHGYYGCESVLRPTKVHDLIQKARPPKTDRHRTCHDCGTDLDEYRWLNRGRRCEGCEQAFEQKLEGESA